MPAHSDRDLRDTRQSILCHINLVQISGDIRSRGQILRSGHRHRTFDSETKYESSPLRLLQADWWAAAGPGRGFEDQAGRGASRSWKPRCSVHRRRSSMGPWARCRQGLRDTRQSILTPNFGTHDVTLGRFNVRNFGTHDVTLGRFNVGRQGLRDTRQSILCHINLVQISGDIRSRGQILRSGHRHRTFDSETKYESSPLRLLQADWWAAAGPGRGFEDQAGRGASRSWKPRCSVHRRRSSMGPWARCRLRRECTRAIQRATGSGGLVAGACSASAIARSRSR